MGELDINRRIEFRAGDAIELLGEPITPDELRDLVDKRLKDPKSYHRKYYPSDVRRAREALHPEIGRYIADRFHQDRMGLPPICTVHISKGGTGKTALTANLGAALSKLGYRVLLIDGDPQGSLTSIFGIDTESPEIRTIRDAIPELRDKKDLVPIEQTVVRVYDQETAILDLIPADQTLGRFEREAMVINLRAQLVNDFVEQNKDFFARYDFVLIDTGPSSSVLNFNLMYPAHMIIVPISLDGMSLKSLEALSGDLADLKKATRRQPSVEIVVNNYHPQFKHSRENLPLVLSEYGPGLSKVNIPLYVGFNRQVRLNGLSRPLVEAEPSSTAAKQYIELAREFADKFIIQPAAKADSEPAIPQPELI